MRDDFRTIYGEDVVKTGSFRWEEEMSEERDAGVQLAAPETQTPADQTDMQYVLYLGTNDKDTNEPVYTPQEAQELAKKVLIGHFGGYTIQEANGGWIGDDGTEYQEYTLVIYLSDATLDQVHEVCDELIGLLHQSSILIQANPTQTEFYSAE